MNLNRSHKIALVMLFAAQNLWAAAPTNNAAASQDYSTFSKFITDRNIFDPNRVPNIPYTARVRPVFTTQARLIDSFSLVGVIGYAEGQQAGVYAFFDGSNFQYQKAAQVNDSIATFKVAAIAADAL